MAYFPMFVQLKKKKCLVIGGGKIALRKIAFSSGGQSPLITQYLKEKIKPDLNKELGQLAQILGSLRKLAKSCIATEQERKAFYKELLQIGLEDIDSLEEQRINEIIQKYISE